MLFVKLTRPGFADRLVLSGEGLPTICRMARRTGFTVSDLSMLSGDLRAMNYDDRKDLEEAGFELYVPQR